MSVQHLPLTAAFSACLVLTSLVATAYMQDSDKPDVPLPGQRYREGSQLERVAGQFRVAVDRVEFHPADEGAVLIVLENLALERVVKELSPELVMTWHVDGMVTEYHGRNYLLLDRAFVKSTRDR